MSKNTSSSQFRKVDVDQFNEDNFQDEVVDDGEDQGPNENEVNTLLSQKQNLEALTLLLGNPPITKDKLVKDRALNLVMRVLTTFKTSEIERAVNSLDSSLIDPLMKYIYRGFEIPSDSSSAVLLAWHEKTFAVGDLGCIVRVLTDRKQV